MCFIITQTDCTNNDTEVLQVFDDKLLAVDYLYNITKKPEPGLKFVIQENGLHEFEYIGFFYKSKVLKNIYKINEYEEETLTDIVEEA